MGVFLVAAATVADIFVIGNLEIGHLLPTQTGGDEQCQDGLVARALDTGADLDLALQLPDKRHHGQKEDESL